jgi:hypothetical protein
MRVTLHIGTYKTATSAIQFALARGGDVLGPAGVRYAQSGLNKVLSKHLFLFDRIIDAGYNASRHRTHGDKDYIGGLVAECSEPGVEHLVVSEEELSYPSPEIAHYFAPLRDVAEVEVVMVVRSQPAFLESLYLQFLKEPNRALVATFEEFLAMPDYRVKADFVALLEPWDQVFGRDAITVVDFDKLRKGGGVVESFGARIGLPGGLPSPDRLINPSVTPAAGELLRRIALAHPTFPRMQLARHLTQLEPGPGTTLVTPKLRKAITKTYKSSNRILADRYGLRLGARPSTRRVLDPAALDALVAEAAVAIIGQTWQRNEQALRLVNARGLGPPPEAAHDGADDALTQVQELLRVGPGL